MTTTKNDPITALVIPGVSATRSALQTRHEHRPAHVVSLATADLASVKACIGGGWIEAVGFDGGHAYVDEEGKIKGLPYNREADLLLRDLGWNPGALDYLCGPVVLFGDVDEEGEETSVSESTLDKARSRGILR